MRYSALILALLLVVTMGPANAGWLFEYQVNYTGDGTAAGFISATGGVGHSRSGAVLGEDSFFFINSGRPTASGANYSGLIYNNCTGATDIPVILPGVWTNPTDASDTINLTWCWGVAADVANNQLFLSNQDGEYSVLVWDLAGAPTQYRNELGFWAQNTYYPSAINLDGTGDIFIANYGMSWIPDGTPAVGNICWYPAIASDPDWATGGANPHNPALGGIYSAIQGATQAYGAGLMSYDGATWICEGVDVSDDGTILVYSSRGGSSAGVYAAVGSPAAGYVLAASNSATLPAYWLALTGNALGNVRGLSLAPDDQNVFFCHDAAPDHILIWNWVTGAFADPISCGVGSATSPRIMPLDRQTNYVPYDVDVYEDDIGTPFALNVLASPYYVWEAATKFTGNLTTDVNDWSLY
jgi:hypothetical protein